MQNSAQTAVTVLIPAFNPDGEFPKLVKELRELGFASIVAVDDGSSRGAEFLAAAKPLLVQLLVHPENRGKGAALKTGIAWIKDNLPTAAAVVTADADGQHRPADIARVAEAVLEHPRGLVLGERAFTGKVPFRSRFGNVWSSWTFFLLTGLKVVDTQTGLRGIPRALLGRMLEIPGNRYSYEMRMLADSRRYPERPTAVPIETVYLANNASSHFHPVRDALRTQLALWACMLFGPHGKLRLDEPQKGLTP